MANYSASVKINGSTNLPKMNQKIVKSFSDLNKRTKNARDSFRKMANQNIAFGRNARVVSAAVAGVAAAFIGLTKSTANYGDDLIKTSEKVGIGVRELQRLRQSARLGGAEIKGFDTGLKIFSRAIDEAGNGMAEYREQFDRLGISLKDTNGQTKDSEQLLFEVADRFAIVEDGAAKASIAQQLFGRSGLDLIPMLNKGSEAIMAQGDELETLGTLMTKEQAEASAQFNDDLLKLNMRLKLLSVSIGVRLMPQMNALVNEFRDAIPEFKALFGQSGSLEGSMSFLASILKGTTILILGVGRGTQIVGEAFGNAAFQVEEFSRRSWAAISGEFGKIVNFWSNKVEPIIDSVKKFGLFGWKALTGNVKPDMTVSQDIEAQIATQRQRMGLDVNMKIDQDGRVRVTGAKSDGDLNLGIQSPLMIPAY